MTICWYVFKSFKTKLDAQMLVENEEKQVAARSSLRIQSGLSWGTNAGEVGVDSCEFVK